MKMKSIIISSMLLTIFMFSCVEQEDSYIIDGNISNAEGQKAYLSTRGAKQHSGAGEKMLDSVIIRDNKFSFTGKIDEPNYYSIVIEGAKGWKPFILENKGISIIGCSDSIWKSTVSGSTESIMADEFTAECNVYYNNINAQLVKYSEAVQNNDSVLVEKYLTDYKNANLKLDSFIVSFVSNNPVSYVSLLNFPINNPDKEKLREIYNSFSENLKSHSKAESIYHDLFVIEKATAIGQPVIDFTLQDINGDSISTKDFRGQYLLIDFWASWCGPCRAENPLLKEVYAKYQSHGFEILGVSLDKKTESWEKAIASDELPWKNVLDNKQKASSKYGIKAIPFNYLIDKKGNILEKNLHDEELIEKLNELLKIKEKV